MEPDDFSDLFGNMDLSGAGDASAAMVSPYPDATGVSATQPGMVNPYPASAQNAEANSWLQMLGMPTSAGTPVAPQAAPGITAGTAPTGAAPQLNPAISAMLPALLGLGISGEKAQTGAGPVQGNVQVPYKTTTATAGSGGGLSVAGKTLGGLYGNSSPGATGAGVGTASVPITAFF